MITRNQVKYIQSLGQKKSRDEASRFIAEGPKLVSELLAAGNCRVVQVYALKEWIDENANASDPAELIDVTSGELKKISQLTTPNQVLAVIEKIKWKDDPTIKGTISLVLDTIQDPRNMGTIIRLADWFGVVSCEIFSNSEPDISMTSVLLPAFGFSSIQSFKARS